MQLLRSVLFGVAAVIAVDAKKCPVGDTSIVAHTGQSVGHIENHNGVDMYVTAPTGCDTRPHHKTAVIFFTDVFGVQLDQDRLLADSFARAGYLTIAPDLFNGKPAPADLNAPGFDRKKFLAEHGPHVADPIIEKTFKYMRETLGIQKIAAAGYCYGGKYSIRYSGMKKGADLAFSAHPALLEDEEVDGIKGPNSLAAAEHDELMSAERRNEITDKLSKTGQIYQVSLYSGTMHGFGVRANVSDPQQKFGKETAFLQAVRFFESWSD